MTAGQPEAALNAQNQDGGRRHGAAAGRAGEIVHPSPHATCSNTPAGPCLQLKWQMLFAVAEVRAAVPDVIGYPAAVRSRATTSRSRATTRSFYGFGRGLGDPSVIAKESGL